MNKNIRDIENFKLYNIYGKHCLFTPEHINKGSLGDGLWVYDIRHADDDCETPVTIELRVTVNRLGSIITDEPIPCLEHINGLYTWININNPCYPHAVVKQFEKHDIKLVDYLVTRGHHNGYWKIPVECIRNDPRIEASTGQLIKACDNSITVFVMRDIDFTDAENENMFDHVSDLVKKAYPDKVITFIYQQTPQMPRSIHQLFDIIRMVTSAHMMVCPNNIEEKYFEEYLNGIIFNVRECMCRDLPYIESYTTILELENLATCNRFTFIDTAGRSHQLLNTKDMTCFDLTIMKDMSLTFENPMKINYKLNDGDAVENVDAFFRGADDLDHGTAIHFIAGNSGFMSHITPFDLVDRFEYMTLDFSQSQKETQQTSSQTDDSSKDSSMLGGTIPDIHTLRSLNPETTSSDEPNHVF